MFSSPLFFNLTRSFGVLLALLLGLVGFAMFNFRALSDANQLNIHTYRVIKSTLELEATLVAIDSAVRGFLVAGEPGSLFSYRRNLRAFDAQIAELRLLEGDDSAQSANFSKLETRKKQWVKQILEPLLARRQTLTDPRQQLAVATGSSAVRRGALRELQSVTRRITLVEEQLLAQRTQNQKRLYEWTRLTLGVGGAFSVLLTGFLVAFAARSARRLHQSNALLVEAKTRAEATSAQLLQINAQLQNEIAARRAADERLRRSVLDLQRSNAELEQFAYIASHDLQEPLRAVGGCVQILQRRYAGQLDARADGFIQHAVDGAQRMQTLINDLLAYSRLGTKTRKWKAREGDLILQNALQSVSVARTESGAQISADTLPVLICDGGQIEQVLQNLLSNALKFRGTDAPPRIHIGYEAREENGAQFHVLSVEDNGVGIEPQYFERIFIMFQRLHTRSEYAGTGIGLAVCKKIVERHGGRIWVESWRANTASEYSSEVKHGTKFSFSLPVKPEIQEEFNAVTDELQNS